MIFRYIDDILQSKNVMILLLKFLFIIYFYSTSLKSEFLFRFLIIKISYYCLRSEFVLRFLFIRYSYSLKSEFLLRFLFILFVHLIHLVCFNIPPGKIIYLIYRLSFCNGMLYSFIIHNVLERPRTVFAGRDLVIHRR